MKALSRHAAPVRHTDVRAAAADASGVVGAVSAAAAVGAAARRRSNQMGAASTAGTNQTPSERRQLPPNASARGNETPDASDANAPITAV